MDLNSEQRSQQHTVQNGCWYQLKLYWIITKIISILSIWSQICIYTQIFKYIHMCTSTVYVYTHTHTHRAVVSFCVSATGLCVIVFPVCSRTHLHVHLLSVSFPYVPDLLWMCYGWSALHLSLLHLVISIWTRMPLPLSCGPALISPSAFWRVRVIGLLGLSDGAAMNSRTTTNEDTGVYF